jgi:large subunit ribosomal protein L25
MKTVTVEGQLRSEFGKKASRQLRSQELVPGVIYGGATEIHFATSVKAFKTLVYTAEFQIAEVKVGENSYKCILKDLQFDKVTDELIHVDLLELVAGKAVVANLPLKFVGQAPGVKAGGRFVPKMNTIKVKVQPEFLTENVEVSIDTLELNENIRVEDIKVENMEIMNSPRIPVASIVMTRQLKQEEAAAAKEAKGKK